jgi:hypothetical protein
VLTETGSRHKQEADYKPIFHQYGSSDHGKCNENRYSEPLIVFYHKGTKKKDKLDVLKEHKGIQEELLCVLNTFILQKSFAPSLKLVPSLKLLAARDRRKRCVFCREIIVAYPNTSILLKKNVFKSELSVGEEHLLNN